MCYLRIVKWNFASFGLKEQLELHWNSCSFGETLSRHQVEQSIQEWTM